MIHKSIPFSGVLVAALSIAVLYAATSAKHDFSITQDNGTVETIFRAEGLPEGIELRHVELASGREFWFYSDERTSVVTIRPVEPGHDLPHIVEAWWPGSTR